MSDKFIYQVANRYFWNEDDAEAFWSQEKDKPQYAPDEKGLGRLYIQTHVVEGGESKVYKNTRLGHRRFEDGSFELYRSEGMGSYSKIWIQEDEAVRLAEDIYLETGRMPGEVIERLIRMYVGELAEQADKVRDLLGEG